MNNSNKKVVGLEEFKTFMNLTTMIEVFDGTIDLNNPIVI